MQRLLGDYKYDKTVYRGKNSSHRLELVRSGNEFSLWLDNYFQFSTKDEPVYHESLVTLPMVLAPKIDNIAILGGGDGLAMREALRFPIKRAFLCELDKEIIDLAKYNPIMYRLNQASLYQPSVRTIIGDAKKFVKNPPMKFDVIIADFPSPTDPKLKKLFTKEFYADVKKSLQPHGIFMTHIGTTHKKRKDVRKTLGEMFKGVVPLIAPTMIMDGASDWYDYVLASDSSLDIQREIPESVRWLNYPRILKMINLGQKKTRIRK